MPFKLAPRLATCNYIGLHRYFLTICVDHRRKVFVTRDRVQPVTTQLLSTATEKGFAVTAYCVMPDHLHGLLDSQTDDSNFREVVRIFKQRSSFEWKRTTGTVLWQRSYYDRVLREDEDTIAVARYILENPVRAKLVKEPLEYPFLGSGTMDVRDLLISL
jgi:REP-associated tyrosine transposase